VFAGSNVPVMLESLSISYNFHLKSKIAVLHPESFEVLNLDRGLIAKIGGNLCAVHQVEPLRLNMVLSNYTDTWYLVSFTEYYNQQTRVHSLEPVPLVDVESLLRGKTCTISI
jgi:hypothetical protein